MNTIGCNSNTIPYYSVSGIYNDPDALLKSFEPKTESAGRKVYIVPSITLGRIRAPLFYFIRETKQLYMMSYSLGTQK